MQRRCLLFAQQQLPKSKQLPSVPLTGLQHNGPTPHRRSARSATKKPGQVCTGLGERNGGGGCSACRTGDQLLLSAEVVASSSGLAAVFLNQRAPMMPTSYKMHMGMASASCEITSGGVTTAAMMKDSTMK